MQNSEILTEKSPESLFSRWLNEAKAQPEIREATAMILATVDAKGHPSSRTVLLKSQLGKRFLFFTNYDSRKGQELKIHPYASLTFYWDPLFKQVHIRGPVSKASREEAETYWATRPRNSQISQWISQQSQTVEASVDLEDLVKKAEIQWQDRSIPCPPHWGGYWVDAVEMEFWIGTRYRLHDRFLFNFISPSHWDIKRLYP